MIKKKNPIFILCLAAVIIYLFISSIHTNKHVEFKVNGKHKHHQNSYSVDEAYSLHPYAITKKSIYTLAFLGDKHLMNVYHIDKVSGKTKIIYKSPFKDQNEYAGPHNIMANDSYAAWLDNNGYDYLNNVIVYDIKKEQIIRKYKDDEEHNINYAAIHGDTIYWLEQDNTQIKDEISTGEDKDTMILGNYRAQIVAYDIKKGTKKKIDTIETVNYPNEELYFSEGKLWYIDNRKYEQTALIKTYDLETNKIKTYDLNIPFLGHLKPVDDNNVAFFKYTIDAAPMGLYLFNTSTNNMKEINQKETDIRAAYDGRGLIISQHMSYHISGFNKIKYNKDIQTTHNDHFLFPFTGPMYNLNFVTSTDGEKNHMNSIVEIDKKSLIWKNEMK